MDLAFGRGQSERLRVHVAAFDRPGYGGSDYHRFTLRSVAADAVGVAKTLGYDRFAVLGFSAGAAAAAVTAALYPGPVTALGVVGGHAPFPEIPEALARLSDGERRALELVTEDENEAERLLAEPDRIFLDVLTQGAAAINALWCAVSPAADRVLRDHGRFSVLHHEWPAVVSTLAKPA